MRSVLPRAAARVCQVRRFPSRPLALIATGRPSSDAVVTPSDSCRRKRKRGAAGVSVATMMASAMIGGAVFQMPLGKVSDKVDRRYVMAGAGVFGAALCIPAAIIAPTTPVEPPSPESLPTPEAFAEEHGAFADYWHQGVAELTRYAIEQGLDEE